MTHQPFSGRGYDPLKPVLTACSLVPRWRSEGHLSAVMKDEGAQRAQQMLERKVRMHKKRERDSNISSL